MEKPKLSICMIVKNEEANLQRCLDSFLPIIQMKDDKTLKPLTELIIVDTGSTDRTINIAKKFTDKIYKKEFIPWDFSKARNYGIGKATGDKIMYMDADEELRQKCLYLLEDIILNPKYEEPTVFVNLYNYYTSDLKQYSEMLQPRIFKNEKDFHFEQAVHNKPICKAPYLFAPHIIFNHYGYIFQGEKGEKLMDNKMARSLPMLQKEFKKHPDNLHNLTHLVKTYYVIKDFENTIRYGEIWIKKMRKANYNEGWNAFLEVFVKLVGSYLAKNDVENAERIEREACHYSSRISQIYLMLGNYWTGKDNEKAKKYFEIALDICKTKGSLYERLLINNAKIVLPEILNWLAIYEFEKKNYEKAGEYMNLGIGLNNNRLSIRWDIWAATENTKTNLIKGTDSQPIKNSLTMEHKIGQLPTIDLLELFPDFEEELNIYSFLQGTSFVTDIMLLKKFARSYPACDYLEIGSFRGESIMNVSEVANHCTSISLSPDEMKRMNISKEYIDMHGVFSKNAKNITEILHDSGTFDFDKLGQKFDLIFIDGDHSYRGVLNDTKKTFNLRKDSTSIIVWHDYGFYTETVRYPVLKAILDGIPAEKHKNLYHVSNTICAVYIENKKFSCHQTKFPTFPNKKFSVKVKTYKIY